MPRHHRGFSCKSPGPHYWRRPDSRQQTPPASRGGPQTRGDPAGNNTESSRNSGWNWFRIAAPQCGRMVCNGRPGDCYNLYKLSREVRNLPIYWSAPAPAWRLDAPWDHWARCIGQTLVTVRRNCWVRAAELTPFTRCSAAVSSVRPLLHSIFS